MASMLVSLPAGARVYEAMVMPFPTSALYAKLS